MPRRILGQGLVYGIIGLTQLAVDWAIFSLVHAFTGATVASNLIGRASAAGLGFWLNGRYTFAAGGVPRLGGERLVRYVIAWLTVTAMSTLAMAGVEAQFGASALYWAKPVVELVLAGVSFLGARYWVYR